MNPTSEFFEGRIAQDYRAILEAGSALDLAAGSKKPKADTSGKQCSLPKVCKTKLDTSGKQCSLPKICKTKLDTSGKQCSLPDVCKTKKKADAFLAGVPGWSQPPAPPAL